MAEPSQFSSYLDTNYAPSDSEIHLLKEFIENQRASVKELTRKIQETKAAATQMEVQRTAYLKSIEDHSKLLSPIRRFPNDILSVIFADCLDTMNRPRYGPGLSREHISVVLSHVSNHWRGLSLHTPILWSYMRVTIPFLRYDKASFAMWAQKMGALNDKIRTWFRRSSAHPIYLEFNSFGSEERSWQAEFDVKARDVYTSILDAIYQASHRLRELACNLYIDCLSKDVAELFERSPGSFPSIEKVTISINGENLGWTEITDAFVERVTSGALFAAPSLRSLEIIGRWGAICAAKAGSTLPLYESLEHLVFWGGMIGSEEEFHDSDAIELLSVLPKLVTCELKINSDFTTLSLTHSAKLPHLTYLAIHEAPVAKGFASAVDFPSLQSLHLKSYYTDDMAPGLEDQENNGVLELFLKFGHQLKRVTMYPDSVTPPALSQCLKQLSSVEWLALLDGNSRRPSPGALALSELSVPGTCPRLQELEVDHITNEPDDLSAEMALVDFLASRRQAERDCRGEPEAKASDVAARLEPIRKVKIVFLDAKQVDIWAELEGRGLALEGLSLHLTYGEDSASETSCL